MLFRYIGDGNEPPQITRPYGYEFKLNGEPVEVTESEAAAKLQHNRCFVEVKKAEVTPIKSKRGRKASGDDKISA